MTERLDELVTKLNDGEGTAGQLLKDKQLYENMNGAVNDLRALLADDPEGSEEIPQRESEHLLMARDDGGGAGSILLAFILGAVSGAAVALLYAPASGRETREYLGEKGGGGARAGRRGRREGARGRSRRGARR